MSSLRTCALLLCLLATSAALRGQGVVEPIPHVQFVPTTAAESQPAELFGELERGGEPERKEEPSDLTLRNLFSEGWREPYVGRSRRGRAPRFHHFTTKQAFLDREARINHFFQENVRNDGSTEHELEIELEIPFNRRMLIDAEPFYTWEDKKDGMGDVNGPGMFVALYLQLVDTYNSAFNVQFGVARFSQSFGVELSESGIKLEEDNAETVLRLSGAGFQDLTPWGLQRVGLSYHLEYVTLVGPNPAGDAKNLFTAGLALAKTLVEPGVPVLGDFTLFVEALAVTALDGENSGRFGMALQPGFRMNLGTEERPWFAVAGLQFPITGPKPFDYTVSFSLIHWFE